MTEVFDEIDKIKKHPIYIEAIRRFWKWFARIVITIFLIITALFIYIFYSTAEYKECMKECMKGDQSNYNDCKYSKCDLFF